MTVSYASAKPCPEGSGKVEGEASCRPCAVGEFSGGHTCERCFAGTFSQGNAGACSPCPSTRGITCVDGVLTPEPGHWHPAAMASGGGTEVFDEDTEVFACLSNTSCRAADPMGNAPLTPANAFFCAEGHRGAHFK